jgi:hypothetical protein
MISPELQGQIAEWRLKAADGTLTQDEMKAAITLLRAGRVSAAYTSDASRRKTAAKTIVHADDLLGELGEL